MRKAPILLTIVLVVLVPKLIYRDKEQPNYEK
jgi:hypothetical protein